MKKSKKIKFGNNINHVLIFAVVLAAIAGVATWQFTNDSSAQELSEEEITALEESGYISTTPDPSTEPEAPATE